jgi:hypothetical protein
MMEAVSQIYRALNGARQGFAVLPADAKTREPLVPHDQASTDPDVIKQWWDEHPSALATYIPPKAKVSATPFVWTDPKDIPCRQWLYGDHLIRKFGSATIAAPGVGKSNLVLAEAVALASGKNFLGAKHFTRCRVWYWNGEDPHEELLRRIAAICLHYRIDKSDLAGWLFVDSGRDQEIVIASETRDGVKIAEPIVGALVATIESNAIDVVQIDPFISSHRVTENDNNAIDIVAKRWTKIANDTDCAIELVHHTRKTNGAEATVEDGRGAGALLAAVRSARVLNSMTKDEAGKAGVTAHRAYFRVENGKTNLAPPPEGADWLHLESVDLGNGGDLQPGDSVGVVVPWQWPNAMDGVTGLDFEAAASLIRAGKWRASSQARDWVGRAVAEAMGLDLGNKADKAKIAGIVATWLKAGSLKEVDGYDEKSVSRKFVEVASE